MPRQRKGKSPQGQQDLFSWRMSPLTEQERDSLAQTYCRCPDGIDPRDNYTDQRNKPVRQRAFAYSEPLTKQLHELVMSGNVKGVCVLVRTVIQAGGHIWNVQEADLHKKEFKKPPDNTLFFVSYLEHPDPLPLPDDKWDWKSDRVFLPVV